MNLYRCNLNCGDTELDQITVEIKAETRGKAKAELLRMVEDAGYQVDWLTPVNIHLVDSNTVSQQ